MKRNNKIINHIHKLLRTHSADVVAGALFRIADEYKAQQLIPYIISTMNDAMGKNSSPNQVALITSAVPLEDTILRQLVAHANLADMPHSNTVDPAVIGGYRIDTDTHRTDRTLQYHMRQLQEHLEYTN